MICARLTSIHGIAATITRNLHAQNAKRTARKTGTGPFARHSDDTQNHPTRRDNEGPCERSCATGERLAQRLRSEFSQMSTKDLIQQEIDKVDEARLPALYELVKRFAKPRTERLSSSETLMERLQKIHISAPSDFSENLDLYLTGEKSFEKVD
jgi:hypothetical protein